MSLSSISGCTALHTIIKKTNSNDVAYSWDATASSNKLLIEITNINLVQRPSEKLRMLFQLWEESCSEGQQEFTIEPTHGFNKTLQLTHHTYSIELLFSNFIHDFRQDYMYEVSCKLKNPNGSASDHLFTRCKSRVSELLTFDPGYLALDSNILIEDISDHIEFYIHRHSPKHVMQSTVGSNVKILKSLGCDIVFEVKGGDFIPAHRSILQENSPMMASMFETDMKEKQTGIVKVLTFEKNVVNKMLEFVYTGQIEDFQDMAESLFDIAYYFQMKHLTEYLQEHYLFNINVSDESIVDLMILADLYNLETIKECLENFRKCHEQKLVAVPSYCEYLIDRINIDNAVTTLMLTIKYNLHNVKIQVFDFIKKNYNKMMKHPDFLKLFISNGQLMQDIHIHVHNSVDDIL